MYGRLKDSRQPMWRWTREIAGLILAVRFGWLVLIVLILALTGDFDTLARIVILVPIVMFVVIVVRLTQWRRRRDK